ncbi:4'-phosphopantetheinyl transferase superfamily protein [Shewanella bicestrii]|uniref:4'-phosphopantetheinyl transferase family protein n=1 Tax=Shewanella sp. GD03713 TaxID=2975372 RepID=UPI000B346837|nr:4'-phosphopantetheinyl transferase superfamily protein [Shewanella sp. GD03713]MDH1471123.1 4'-phosphopantetheinyl transferase superfamily protein [Shewanella sp. GD03713]QXN26236.1 4'-phosphopantetheinyl transferase superfamily protein [Shewanella putrefaciens]
MNIELFFIPLTEMDTASTNACMALLSEDERAKVARYRAPKAQMNGLLVRSALRCVLSQGLQSRGGTSPCSSQRQIAPQDWCFEYGAKGKPSLNHEQFLSTGIEFNLSHSGDWLLIALAQDDDKGETANTAQPRLGLGVDIERARASTHIYPILNHYFSPIEAEGLLALEGEDAQRQRFFDLWALKESYIKATGLGLAQSLKSFAFDLAPNSLLAVDDGVLQTVDTPNRVELKLKLQDNFASPSQAKPCSYLQLPSRIPLYSNIKLLIEPETAQDATSSHAQHWRSYFGRLDEEYRFGLSLVDGDSLVQDDRLARVTISMQLTSITALLAACSAI